MQTLQKQGAHGEYEIRHFGFYVARQIMAGELNRDDGCVTYVRTHTTICHRRVLTASHKDQQPLGVIIACLRQTILAITFA